MNTNLETDAGLPSTGTVASRENSRMLWALGLGGFLVNADNRAIAPMLPAIAIALHTSASVAALLVTAYSIPYGLFQLVYGPLADRFGKINTILVSLLLFAVGTVACGFVHTLPSLMVLRVITGMFAAGIIPTTLAQIGDRFPTEHRPRAIAFFMSLSTSGQAMGIVIGGFVAQFFSYRVLFLFLGLAAIPTILAMVQQKRASEPVGERLTSAIPLVKRYLHLFSSRWSFIVYGLVLLEGFVFYGGFTFLGVYGVSVLHLSYLVVGLLTAMYSLGAFLGSRSITTVLKRMGTTYMPVFGAGAMTLGFGIAATWMSTASLTIGFVLLGLGFSFCHSTLQTFATELLPEGRATAVSVFAFFLFLGSGVGPIVGGQLMDGFGIRVMLGLVAIGMAVFALLCFGLLRGRGIGRHGRA